MNDNPFMDQDLSMVLGSTIILTQSAVEKRSRVLASRQELIVEATKKFQDRMAEFKTSMYVIQPVITAIKSKEVDEEGRIKTGSVEWSIQASSPMSKRVARIGVVFRIINGQLKSPKTFTTASGQVYMLSKEAIKKAIGTNYDQDRPKNALRFYQNRQNISQRQEI